jgi:uncharacterized protein YaeQ
MALKSTIYKAGLTISDMDRGYYGDHSLTVARHPSETDERMMLRILAFALHASEAMALAKGLADTEEPDFWEKDLTDAIMIWGEIGQPDDRRLLRASSRSRLVIVYCVGDSALRWWSNLDDRAKRIKNLEVRHISQACAKALAALANRTMHLQVSIQDEQAWMTQGEDTVPIEWTHIKRLAKS